MRDKASVDRQLIALRDLPYGITRTVATERTVARVEAEGPQACLAFAYLELVEAYTFGGEASKVLVPYTKVLRLADQSPGLLDAADTHNLLWTAKWVGNEIIETPEMPVARVNTLLDDLEQRFSLAGAGLDAIWCLRTRWADERDAPDTQAVFDTWVATPRDEFSHCAACDPAVRAGYLYKWGRTDDAVRLFEDALASGDRCGSEPVSMLSQLALAYLDQGRTDDAVVAHRRSLAELDRTEVPATAVRGRVLRFLARVGAHDAALRRIRDDEAVMLAPGEPAGRRLGGLVSLGSAAACLARTDPDRELRSMAARTTTVGEYAAWCRTQADDIAAAFDARYGDDHITRRVSAVWDVEVVPVDLSVLAATAEPPPDRPTPGQAGEPAATAGRYAAVTTDAAPRPGRDRSPTDLLRQAEQTARRGDLVSAALGYQQAGNGFVAAGLLTDAGFAFAELAHTAQVLEDHDGAHAAFARAVDLLRAGGTEPALVAPVVRAWTTSACAVGAGEATLDRLAQTAAELVVADDVPAPTVHARQHEAAAVEDVRARALATLGRWDEARVAGQAAAEALSGLGAWAAAGQASWLVGRLVAQAGEVDEAAAHYSAAAVALARAYDREQQVKVLDDLVRLLRDADRYEEADEVVTRLLHDDG